MWMSQYMASSKVLRVFPEYFLHMKYHWGVNYDFSASSSETRELKEQIILFNTLDANMGSWSKWYFCKPNIFLFYWSETDPWKNIPIRSVQVDVLSQNELTRMTTTQVKKWEITNNPEAHLIFPANHHDLYPFQE